MERRLAEVARTTLAFAAALRAYRKARLAVLPTGRPGARATRQPPPRCCPGSVGNPPGSVGTPHPGVKGDLDHFSPLGFLQGMLTVLRDCGHPGLHVVLDEIEILQRVRSDVRDKGRNAPRQLIDDVDAGRFPSRHLVITGGRLRSTEAGQARRRRRTRGAAEMLADVDQAIADLAADRYERGRFKGEDGTGCYTDAIRT